MSTITVTAQLTTIHCGECAGTYAIDERYREQRYQKGESWTCPYCKCGWGYSGQSENALLKKKIEEKNAEIARANSVAMAQRQAADMERAAKEKAERKLKRVGNGMCPCCNRTFKNLARHMAVTHAGKDFALPKTIKPLAKIP